jgi:hypothetical protein
MFDSHGDLKDTLDRINNVYGRGTVVAFAFNADGRGGSVVVKYGWVGRGMKSPSEIVDFKIDGNRIKFRGVTRKVGYVSR